MTKKTVIQTVLLIQQEICDLGSVPIFKPNAVVNVNEQLHHKLGNIILNDCVLLTLI